MGRQPCCDKIGLKRGPWTIEEDHKLMNFILNNGIHCWRMVPKLADNEIKNHWNTRIKKKLKQLGLDPVTHKPIEQKEMGTGSGVNNKTIPEYNSSTGKRKMSSMDLGSWTNQLETNTTTYSSSLSADESNNPSIGESPSVQDMDYILSWESFNHLVDDILFVESSRCNIPADSVSKFC
ncbi:hypothetical protein GH714_041841 [Hevea brasiliensis]|uniref:Uncharacterized protein n=1 Tax=Hevea brasiliensis TaxID=3981 RepID=A0A6A6MSH3_HEVBR|nr:hypothetical protein GH714_041841 [Hevea brasiliensis]